MKGLTFVLMTFMSWSIINVVEGVKKTIVRRLVAPIGENQQQYCDYLADMKVGVVAGLGPAGCGKTLFACQAAVASLVAKDVDKIIMTRPMVSVDEELGFLPGSLEQKMDPWVRPIFDILGDLYSKTEIKQMMNERVIEIAPLAYMRGRTFKRAFIVADEMQNSSPNQMLMLLTRIGEGSKMVITGDLQQSDLVGRNGLADFHGRLKKSLSSEFGGGIEGIKSVEFESGDVKRSSVVSSIFGLYADSSNPNKLKDDNRDAALMPMRDIGGL
jgi:phosphate starvation-inducible PhoH-like protein